MPPPISSRADTSKYCEKFICFLYCSAASLLTSLKCFKSFLLPTSRSTTLLRLCSSTFCRHCCRLFSVSQLVRSKTQITPMMLLKKLELSSGLLRSPTMSQRQSTNRCILSSKGAKKRRVENCTPMVLREKGSNLFWQSRSRMLVLPTPESPMTMILILYSSLALRDRSIIFDFKYSEQMADDRQGYQRSTMSALPLMSRSRRYWCRTAISLMLRLGMKAVCAACLLRLRLVPLLLLQRSKTCEISSVCCSRWIRLCLKGATRCFLWLSSTSPQSDLMTWPTFLFMLVLNSSLSSLWYWSSSLNLASNFSSGSKISSPQLKISIQRLRVSSSYMSSQSTYLSKIHFSISFLVTKFLTMLTVLSKQLSISSCVNLTRVGKLGYLAIQILNWRLWLFRRLLEFWAMQLRVWLQALKGFSTVFITQLAFLRLSLIIYSVRLPNICMKICSSLDCISTYTSSSFIDMQNSFDMPGPEILRAIEVSLLGVLPTFLNKNSSSLSTAVRKQRCTKLKRKMKSALMGASRVRLSVRSSVMMTDLRIMKTMLKMGTERTTSLSGMRAVQNWQMKMLKVQVTSRMIGTQAQTVITSTNEMTEATTITMGQPIKVRMTPTNRNLKRQHSMQLKYLLMFFPKRPRSGVAQKLSRLFFMPSNTVKKVPITVFLVWQQISPVWQLISISQPNSCLPQRHRRPVGPFQTRKSSAMKQLMVQVFIRIQQSFSFQKLVLVSTVRSSEIFLRLQLPFT